MKLITDIIDERISLFRNLRKTPASHKEEKVFIGEGTKVNKKLLESNIEILSFFALPEFYEQYNELIIKKVEESKRFTASAELMNNIVGFRLHEGIMSIARQPEFTDPEALDNRIIAMNGIINSENVGAIARNCAAFGFNSLIFDNKTSSPYLRRAVRVSMGSVIDLKVSKTESLIQTLINLKGRGYSILAAENTESAISLGNFSFPDKYVLIFGTESKGVDKSVIEICDAIIKIPINDSVQSINVAASSAVMMYEAVK